MSERKQWLNILRQCAFVALFNPLRWTIDKTLVTIDINTKNIENKLN